MKRRWRVMIVVTKSPARGLQFVTAEALGPPPWDVAMMGARLLRHGAEVRVLDQDTEHLGHRVVRRELKNWCPDLVLLYAGGSVLADNPVPEVRNLSALMTGWDWPSPVLACGPLATHYGRELLTVLPRLTGLMRGPVGEAMAQGFDSSLPGVASLVDGELVQSPLASDVEEVDADVMPAWHLFSLDAYASRCAGGLRTILIGNCVTQPSRHWRKCVTRWVVVLHATLFSMIAISVVTRTFPKRLPVGCFARHLESNGVAGCKQHVSLHLSS